MKSHNLKGYAFALVATIAFSNIYIFSKAALNHVHLAQFGLYWFIVAALFNVAWFLFKGQQRRLPQLSRKQWQVLALLGVLEIITTGLFYLSIQVIPDPAVTSFLGNLYPVFLTAMGVSYLREKFSVMEVIGASLALLGAFVVSYQGGTSISEFFIPGAGIVLFNAFFAALASVVVKLHVRDLGPELINTNRSIWLLLFSVVMFVVLRQPFVFDTKVLANIAFGAFMGDFLAVLLIYYSFFYIEVSKSSIVQSTKVVFVLIGSILYFGNMPLLHQLAGGALTMTGVILISAAKLPRFSRE